MTHGVRYLARDVRGVLQGLTLDFVAKYDKVIFLRNHSSSITRATRQTRVLFSQTKGQHFRHRRNYERIIKQR